MGRSYITLGSIEISNRISLFPNTLVINFEQMAMSAAVKISDYDIIVIARSVTMLIDD